MEFQCVCIMDIPTHGSYMHGIGMICFALFSSFWLGCLWWVIIANSYWIMSFVVRCYICWALFILLLCIIPGKDKHKADGESSKCVMFILSVWFYVLNRAISFDDEKQHLVFLNPLSKIIYH